MIDKDITPEIILKMKNLSLNMQKELNSLMQWIQHPIYSPDHPIGNNMMNKSMEHFQQNLKDNGKSYSTL